VPSVPRAQLLAEPVARNTAPCIGWAAATIARRDPDAVIAVLPSDHYIADEAAFRRVLQEAVDTAGTGCLVTIGIVPTRPETGYGYIELGAALDGGRFKVLRFVEKPDRAQAEAFLQGKKHLWNAGMFFFKASAILDAIRAELPELAAGLTTLDEAAARGDEARALKEVFPKLPSISIDHGVMERVSVKGDGPGLAVVKGDFGWNDVGSWESAWELAEKDAQGNALPSGSVTVDAAGNFVCDRTTAGGKRIYALVGVSDLVLVETDDAVLIIPRERAQEVRSVVDALKARGDTRRL
jgi:mannose-1-phosphate guanylyltransferase